MFLCSCDKPPKSTWLTNIRQGCAFGGIKGRSQLPDLVDDYMKGKLKVDEFITHRKHLQDINQAFDVMKQGDCIRCVVTMRDQ
jgi:S-(hydroxymethyl)glutathione dehydrogenase/alcohol dehydrogenase